MERKGFTLIELIMVIVLIGILAVFTAPKLGNITSTKSGASSDKLRADIRYAQSLAMSRNQRARVTFTATTYDVTIGGLGNHATDPATGKLYPVTLDPVITITIPTGFTGDYVEFDALGVPYDGSTGGACMVAPCPLTANESVTVTNGQTVTVTYQTGAVN